MKKLNYETLQELGYSGYLLPDAPERVLQFGEGNFLRAFSNVWFDLANQRTGWNGKCVLVQPIQSGLADLINQQQGLYTLYLRGIQDGRLVDEKRVISSVSRALNPYQPQDYQAMLQLAASPDLEYIVSNTTEAGIVYDPSCRFTDQPPSSFPAKLTQVLLARYQAGLPGLVILSCELIDNNGKELLHCVRQYIQQWRLAQAFLHWVEEECVFCSTLVDRIVPGRIRDAQEMARLEEENGYQDDLADVSEVFGVWNIEGPAWLEEKLPFAAAGLNCPVVADVTPYKKWKVRILNGGHTGMVLGAYLAGLDIVGECMEHPTVRAFLNKMLQEEIVPILPLNQAECLEFATAVQERFQNPFIRHELLSIALNSTAKWKARNLPSLLEYQEQKGTLPSCLVTGFASYIAFYSSNIQEINPQGQLVCKRENGDSYAITDDNWVLEFYWQHRNDSTHQLVAAVLSNCQMWGQDLTQIPNLTQQVTDALELIRTQGALAAYKSCL